MERVVFVVEEEYVGYRADLFLSAVSSLSRARVKALCDEGEVCLFEKPIRASRILRVGDVITAYVPDPVELNLEPQDIPLDIVYEDDCLAVINKQQGLVVHPSLGTPTGTMVNALLFHLSSLSSINGVIRPGIVHRLDKDTSGLLVVAKNDEAHRSLALQISEKTAVRKYYALLDGVLKPSEGTIDAPLARSKSDRMKIAVDREGKRAVTHFTVLERYKNYTFVEFVLETGRTHQIRVHAKYVHHPVVGDKTYGKPDAFHLNGQLLHSHYFSFTHPVTNERMEFEAPLPDYFQAVLDKVSKIN